MTEEMKQLIEQKRANIAHELDIPLEALSFRVDDNYVYFEYITEKKERQFWCQIKLDILSDTIKNEVKHDIEKSTVMFR